MKKFKDDQVLKTAFYLGGVYDLFLGVGLLFFSDLVVSILDYSYFSRDIVYATLAILM